ncbi:MAG: L-2-amino-thiazoline-4-carboxylic acid hydrolase, partial [Candidatus Bipolaricaulota bacterium]
MSERKEVPLDEAKEEVELASRRIGLLHLAYAETLIDELGEKEGKKMILESIKNYGLKIGAEVRKQIEEEGLDPEPDNFGKGSSRNLPKFGMNEGTEEVTVEGEERLRHGCAMAKVWKEYGQEEIGKLYCYVDPAKFMGFNPCYKMVHTKNEPSGDNYCEFAIRETSEQERNDFSSKMAD